jgi:hypothetical protein
MRLDLAVHMPGGEDPFGRRMQVQQRPIRVAGIFQAGLAQIALSRQIARAEIGNPFGKDRISAPSPACKA